MNAAPDQYGVIGHPIAHSLSPRIHALFAEQTQQHLQYTALDVPPAQLEARVRNAEEALALVRAEFGEPGGEAEGGEKAGVEEGVDRRDPIA